MFQPIFRTAQGKAGEKYPRSLAFISALIWLAAGFAEVPAQTVREWLVLGSFAVEAGQGLDTNFIVREDAIRPHGGLMTSDKPWRHYFAPEPHLNFLDLTLDFFPVENAVAYAHVYVHSPKADTVEFTLGGDDRLLLRVNGQIVLRQNGTRAHKSADDTLAVPLREGWNSVLLKVLNGVGEWWLSAHFQEPNKLKVQAEIPDRLTTVPRPNPELVRIRTVEPAEHAIFTRDDKPALQFKTVLYNPQQRALGACRARLLTRAGKIVGEAQSFELRAGELRTLYFIVPASAIVESYQASGSWQIRLQFEQQEVRRVVPLSYDGRLLGKILGTFEVEGVERLATNGSDSFRRVIHVPWEWTGMPLLLSADFGEGQGEVLINDESKAVQITGYSGDILLADSAQAGSRHEIVMHVTHAGGKAGESVDATPRLFLTVENLALLRYLTAAALQQQFRGDASAEQKALDEKMFAALKARDVQTLNQLIAEAYSKLPEMPEALASVPNVSLVGNAILDFSKLLSPAGQGNEAGAVFRQVIGHLAKFPDFHFAQGQAFAYWWIEQHDPTLFENIRQAAQQNRWEIVGGTWVEPDLNLLSGESLARQFLYGKRYFKVKFGVEPKVAWMPGASGHPWSLPQILKKSGMSSYLFYRPGEAMKLFQWEGLDGSRVTGYRPPDQYGSQLTRDVGRHALVSKQRFNWPKALRLYAVGNRGSGPTSRNIRLAEDLAYATAGRAGHLAVPSVRMAPASGFFNEIDSKPATLAIHRDEINLMAPGTWAQQARHKLGNRRCETLLPLAETFALIAGDFGCGYPALDFAAHWGQVLAHQHYSLMSGAGSAETYADAQRIHREVAETARGVIDNATGSIEAAINTRSKNPEEIPTAIFNLSAWARTDYVEVEINLPAPPGQKNERKAKTAEEPQAPYFRDAAGAHLPAQVIARDSTAEGIHYRLLFLPENVPALGYKVYWFSWARPEAELPQRVRIDAEKMAMSNRDFSLSIHPRSGALVQMVDNQLNREWMASNTGGLEVWSEAGEESQASGMSHGGARQSLSTEDGIEILEQGPLRGRLRARFRFNHSTVTQDYVMYATLPRVEVQYQIDWNEPGKKLALVYPFSLPEARTNFEIPFGAITRPADGREAPMQKWLDLSNDQFGVAVSSDGVFSAQVQEETVRLLLWHSPEAQNLEANGGGHELSVALTPHLGDWKQARITRTSEELCRPLLAKVLTQHAGNLAPEHSFVSLEPGNVVLSALKKAEDDDSWVVRLQETAGAAVNATFTLPFAASAVSEVNLMEWEEKPLPLTGAKLTVTLGAWEVKALKIKRK